MIRNLLFLFVFALAVYSLADVLSSDDQRRGGTPKFMWFIIVCIPVLGPVVWLVFVSARKSAVPQQGGHPAGSGTPYYGTRTTGARAVAPDDDPEFLWKLAAEQRRKREAEERAKRESEARDTDEDPDKGPADKN